MVFNKKTIQEFALLNIESDLDRASIAFAFLYKFTSDNEALHNFAVFLTKYGKECNLIKNKFEFIQQLFIELCEKKPDHESFKEFGDFYFINHNYEKAIDCYAKSLSFHEDCDALINLAYCYFQTKCFVQSRNILSTVIKKYIHRELPIDVYITHAFSELFCDDYINKKQIFHNLTAYLKNDITPEILQIALYCEEYQFVIDNYREVLNNWIFDINTFKIIHRTYSICHPESLNDFLSFTKAWLKQFEVDNPDFDRDYIRNFSNCLNNGPFIPDFSYVPEFIIKINFL